ncbi:MAG: phosphotyrosine protein phosphatase [Nanobdellota archaeon]
MKVLFICHANLQRSPTAEELYKDKYEAKSAGVHPMAVKPVTNSAKQWADKIIVMEDWMKRFFPSDKTLSLEIPDRFEYMDPELVKIIRERMEKQGL